MKTNLFWKIHPRTITLLGLLAIVASSNIQAVLPSGDPETWDISTIDPNDIPSISHDDIPKFTTNQIRDFTSQQIKKFTELQIPEFTTGFDENGRPDPDQVLQIQEFTSDQIPYFTENQIPDFTPHQIYHLEPHQIRAFTTGFDVDRTEFDVDRDPNDSIPQIQALTPQQIEAFDINKIQYFQGSQIPYFTREQIQAFTPIQISEFTFSRSRSPDPRFPDPFRQMEEFTTDQIPHFTTGENNTHKQIQAFSPLKLRKLIEDDPREKIRAFTPAQIGALTTGASFPDTTLEVGERNIAHPLWRSYEQVQRFLADNLEYLEDDRIHALTGGQLVALDMHNPNVWDETQLERDGRLVSLREGLSTAQQQIIASGDSSGFDRFIMLDSNAHVLNYNTDENKEYCQILVETPSLPEAGATGPSRTQYLDAWGRCCALQSTDDLTPLNIDNYCPPRAAETTNMNPLQPPRSLSEADFDRFDTARFDFYGNITNQDRITNSRAMLTQGDRNNHTTYTTIMTDINGFIQNPASITLANTMPLLTNFNNLDLRRLTNHENFLLRDAITDLLVAESTDTTPLETLLAVSGPPKYGEILDALKDVIDVILTPTIETLLYNLVRDNMGTVLDTQIDAQVWSNTQEALEGYDPNALTISPQTFVEQFNIIFGEASEALQSQPTGQ